MNNFKNIFGQDLALKILQSAISEKHIAPAYLFSGPEGVGRKTTAKIFIKLILDNGLESESIKRKIESNNHPDLLWIEPKYLVHGKSISQREAKLENISIKAPPQIKINQIKDIIDFLGKKPLESEKSIVVIEDIEKMNESASNALLKTLEEPNEGLFILITKRQEKLLATIKSRCQIVPFKRLKEDQLKNIINGTENIEKIYDIQTKTIEDLLIFSNGSPGIFLANLEYLKEIPSSLRNNNRIKLTNKIESLKLAKEITDELNIEQQLWLISFYQNNAWEKENNSKIVLKLEELRKQLLSYVQPRLAWEVTLLEISLIN